MLDYPHIVRWCFQPRTTCNCSLLVTLPDVLCSTVMRRKSKNCRNAKCLLSFDYDEVFGQNVLSLWQSAAISANYYGHKLKLRSSFFSYPFDDFKILPSFQFNVYEIDFKWDHSVEGFLFIWLLLIGFPPRGTEVLILCCAAFTYNGTDCFPLLVRRWWTPHAHSKTRLARFSFYLCSHVNIEYYCEMPRWNVYIAFADSSNGNISLHC